MPAARATATQWIKWLVDPPVASSATIALTMQRSSTMRPIGAHNLASAAATGWSAAANGVGRPSTVRTASRVSSSRSAAPGLTNAVPGTCSPMASSNIWLLLAVP